MQADRPLSPRETMRLLCATKAAQMWAAFDENKKAGVRFGMFPAAEMREAEKEGHDGRLLAIELMNCATKDGGMRA